MFSEAFQGLQQNLRTLLLYAGSITLCQSGRLLVELLYLVPVKETLDPRYLNAYTFSATILTALVLAAIQSVCFARFGEKIDRPFWKISGDWEAIKRFYKLWFLLDLGILTLMSIPTAILDQTGDEELAAMLQVLTLGIAVLALPFGSAVMFYGKFAREEVKAAIHTLASQFPRVIVIMALNYCVAIVLSSILAAETMTPWLSPLVFIVDAYVDCLIFCCIWYLCIAHRDEDTEDIDFDF